MTPFTQAKIGTLTSLLVATLAFPGRASAEDVPSPTKRTEVLAAARTFLAVKETSTTIKDPFHSEAFAETIATNTGATTTKAADPAAPRVQAGPRTNRDLLQAIATSLRPRYLELGGQPILFFGQKRVKAGDSMTINFEGSDYALEIVSIEKPNFTLRLNRDEFTRPIK